MDQEQRKAAQLAMEEWLEHPQELGKKPCRIEIAGEFDLHDLHYYIFRYKKTLLGKWLLGVCGGYEEGGLEHCGHVFSEMKEYSEKTAREDAVAIVENIRAYWMEQAQKGEEKKGHPGNFVNFVLLKDAVWDKALFLKQLKEDWNIEEENEEAKKKLEEHEDVVLTCRDGMLSVALMPAAVPNEEAEYHARKNYTWKDGVDIVKQHQAHLLVAVLGAGASATAAGTLLVKAVLTCCKQGNVLGIYANETVYQPQLYQDFARMLYTQNDLFPVFNLVWFGLYNGQSGVCGYTCGMRNFGYDEMEVLDSAADAQAVMNFLSDVANYVICENVLLRDGETIGFTAEQKLPITKSRGVAVEGDSLKIRFP